MKQVNFSKKRLAVTISMLLGTGVVTPSYAAEETAPAAIVEDVQEDEIEVIEVSGIRGGLIRSMDLKRDSSGVMDVISSEDMGKFPDTNLAESLQRITGVTVSRSNGEGSQITVRGFGPDFNLVTLNGRTMPGTGNSRSYNFENLSSDGVSALEVHKTARAKNPSGGLGATVNIVTLKPMNSPGLKYSVSAKGMHDTSNEEGNDVTPEVSAVYSNTFDDETFGFAFSVTHSRRDFQQQSANIQGWQANVALPTNLDAENVIDPRPLNDEGERIGDYFFPRDMNYGINNVERERTNGNVTFQYAPIDDLILSLDYTATKVETGSNSIGWGQWHDYGGNINAYELDENGTAIFADMSGNDGSYTASRGTTEVDEESFGFNVAWQATDSFHFELDYHDSTNEIDNGADDGMDGFGSLVLGSDQLRTKTYDYRTGEVPHAQIFWNNGTTTLAPSEIDSHFSQFVHNPGKSTVEQVQLHGTWDNNDFDIPLVNIKFGVAHSKQKMSGSNAWSGLIGGFLFNPDYTAMLPDGMFELHSTSGFLDEFSGGGSSLAPSYYYTFDFDEVAARSAAFLTNEELGGDDYFEATAYHDLGTVSSGWVEEETDSVYLQSLWDFEIAEIPVQVNIGVRYEETDVTNSNSQPIPVEVWWKGGSEWHTQHQPGGNASLDLSGSHDVFLPMLDIKVDITDELVGRVSWGKTIARAPLGSLAGGLTLSGSPKIGSRDGGSGNTDLQPYESTNFDLSLEYYYAEGSYASIGYFKKEVENFIGNEIVQQEYEGIHDIWMGERWDDAVDVIEGRGEQATNDAIFAQIQASGSALNEQGYLEPVAGDPIMEWNISRPFNSSEDKEVDGFELAIQHLFGETGFGVGANATFVDGDVEFDVKSLDQQTPLTGLSDSANFQLFYEKHGLSVKVTYAWRDEYLLGVGQSQGSADAPPQFAKEFGQIDMSINYNVTDRLTVFFEGINLNDETEQVFGRYEEQFLSARQYGPRYAIGARYSFK
ncbi:TonB-dependent receptor [Thalassotalea sp. 42_200_T64]|nr:TonB-dependent receptor [Thalassotalea sp. 42_200_T64]